MSTVSPFKIFTALQSVWKPLFLLMTYYIFSKTVFPANPLTMESFS
jgi:hypothetical protein